MSKFHYGLRAPFSNAKLIDTKPPKRGDVVVFRPPFDKSQHYVKRLIGMPGDLVEFRDKELVINGIPVSHSADGDFYDSDLQGFVGRYTESLLGVNHPILINEAAPASSQLIRGLPDPRFCSWMAATTARGRGVRCSIPKGFYFMMGDNRDNSADSRYWGFVADQDLVGKAFFILMNPSSLSRIGLIQ